MSKRDRDPAASEERGVAGLELVLQREVGHAAGNLHRHHRNSWPDRASHAFHPDTFA